MWNLRNVLLASGALRAGMLFYGLYQDAHSSLKYTDVDYYVFTDAARYITTGHTPYDRETYRYTPLLAWLLVPTTFQPQWLWFSFGKLLFAAGDLVAGWLIYSVLRTSYGGMEKARALKFAGIWLLNPMVATISTRGSSEGLLGVMVVALVWAAVKRRAVLTGVLLGLAVHFKIYPVIYGPAILWWMEGTGSGGSLGARIVGFCSWARVKFGVSALVTFVGLNLCMWMLYGSPFIDHTYAHHVTRLDHRHNFSPYNVLLYLTSAPAPAPPAASGVEPPTQFSYASVAFFPQLFLSGVLLPLAFAKWDLPTTLFAQTFAFVTFNKVCTSQYFMWYIVLLPFYLPTSSLLRRPRLGLAALAAWVAAQAAWLHQGYELEFLGKSTFFPGLWASSLAFFAVNVWLLGIIVVDVKDRRAEKREVEGEGKKTIKRSNSSSARIYPLVRTGRDRS